MISALPNVSELPIAGNGAFSRPWYAFFRDLLGSFGAGVWTPAFTGLTVVGTVNYTGTFVKTGKSANFTILISPVGAATTASTAGVSFTNNLPQMPLNLSNAMVTNADSVILIGPAIMVANTRNLSLPTWAPTNNRILISGSYQTES